MVHILKLLIPAEERNMLFRCIFGCRDVVLKGVCPTGRGEDIFERMLAAKGFVSTEVCNDMLHEEYREGAYKILRVARV